MVNETVKKLIAITGLVSLLAGCTAPPSAAGASYRTTTHSSFTESPSKGMISCWIGYSPTQTYSFIKQTIETTYLFGTPIHSEVIETKEYEYPCFKPIEGKVGKYELLVPML